jgi:phage/plasmid-like protein (TIGR03299 family)
MKEALLVVRQTVENVDAFRFLDALIGSEMHFETAGSLWGGRRVWVLARLPEYVELGGDLSATYIYVANSHDGSMAVTAAVTPIRIVCANTLGAALRQAEHGVAAQRTFRFRHTGDLQAKFVEARQVLGMTIDYQKQFKELADRLALEPISALSLERSVLRHLWTVDEDMGKVAAPIASGRSRTSSRTSAAGEPPGIPAATARAPSGSRSTRSPSTSTTVGATARGPTRSSARSKTHRSSSGRSSSYARLERSNPLGA